MTDRTCSVEGCTNKPYGYGRCHKHHQRWKKYGTTDLPPRPTAIDRFLAKVEWSDQRHDGTRCLQWTAATRRRGYGIFGEKGKHYVAHRWLYARWVGPIPEGLHLDHLCRNHGCVNPAHLEPVTSQVNTLRGVGPSAINAKKTHCPKGHPYDEENTSVSGGRRSCKACGREKTRRQYWKKRGVSEPPPIRRRAA